MTDLDLQKFSMRIDAAVADDVLTVQEGIMAKAALEGGGIPHALAVLEGLRLQKAQAPAEDLPQPEPEPPAQPDSALAIAEDLADLRDELNRDLGSEQAKALVQKIAQALAA